MVPRLNPQRPWLHRMTITRESFHSNHQCGSWRDDSPARAQAFLVVCSGAWIRRRTRDCHLRPARPTPLDPFDHLARARSSRCCSCDQASETCHRRGRLCRGRPPRDSPALAAFFVEYSHYSVITFVIGGVIGALMLLALFDWVLILLSSIEGAHLISKAIILPQIGTAILCAALVLIGLIVQRSMLRGSRKSAG